MKLGRIDSGRTFPELTTSHQSNDRYIGEVEEAYWSAEARPTAARHTHGEPNNIAEMIETTMPRIGSSQLLARRNIQDEITQGRL